jgi:hypothetical protein
VSTDQKGPRILAHTFYAQLRASGYTPQQVIGIATELLDMVTDDLKSNAKQDVPPAASEVSQGFQPRV